MIERLIRNFKLYFPNMSKSVINYKLDTSDCLVVIFKDGNSSLYDDLDNTIRPLPKNSNTMTELEFRKEFSKRLYRFLYWKGITQDDLAKKTGISRVSINKYLNCRSTPSFYIIDKITKALGCPIDYFRYMD